jgi:formylmethanofuran dehydrogenase subunit B
MLVTNYEETETWYAYNSVTPLPQEQVRHLQSVPHLPLGPLFCPSSPVVRISTTAGSVEVEGKILEALESVCS